MDEAEVIPYYLRPEKATRQASVVVVLLTRRGYYGYGGHGETTRKRGSNSERERER